MAWSFWCRICRWSYKAQHTISFGPVEGGSVDKIGTHINNLQLHVTVA
jgi:hypothetical protein